MGYKILKYALRVILGVLAFLFLILFLAYLTGRTQRDYDYSKINEFIHLANDKKTVAEVVEKFKPVVLIDNDVETPELMWVWYEVIEKETYYDIVYYNCWKNEINPNKNIHRLYSIFRAAYYGYPLYDIEYFQIRVSKDEGDVIAAFYETSLNDDYYQILPVHIEVKLERINDIKFYGEFYSKEDKLVKKEELEPLFQQNRMLTGVQTWNHLTTVVTENKPEKYLKEINSELKYLTKEDYSKFKFVRKSQGTNKTTENLFSSIVAAIAINLFIKIPSYFISMLKK